jgi:hypothetical protein
MQASDGCGGTVLSGRRGETQPGTGDGRRREAGVDVFVDVGRLDVRNTSKYSVQVGARYSLFVQMKMNYDE